MAEHVLERATFALLHGNANHIERRAEEVLALIKAGQTPYVPVFFVLIDKLVARGDYGINCNVFNMFLDASKIGGKFGRQLASNWAKHFDGLVQVEKYLGGAAPPVSVPTGELACMTVGHAAKGSALEWQAVASILKHAGYWASQHVGYAQRAVGIAIDHIPEGHMLRERARRVQQRIKHTPIPDPCRFQHPAESVVSAWMQQFIRPRPTTALKRFSVASL